MREGKGARGRGWVPKGWDKFDRKLARLSLVIEDRKASVNSPFGTLLAGAPIKITTGAPSLKTDTATVDTALSACRAPF